MEPGKTLLRFRTLAIGDGENSKLWIVGRNDLKRAVLDFGKFELHIALAAKDPNISNQDVVQDDLVVFALDNHPLRSCVRRHR